MLSNNKSERIFSNDETFLAALPVSDPHISPGKTTGLTLSNSEFTFTGDLGTGNVNVVNRGIIYFLIDT